MVKTPKLYFYDVGLAAHLQGIRTADQLENSNLLGSLFENLVITDLIKRNHHDYLLRDYYFWRDSNGHEVGLLYKEGNRFNIFEVKSTQTILPKLFKGMDYLTEITQGKVDKRTLIYGGTKNQDRTKYQIRTWDTA